MSQIKLSNNPSRSFNVVKLSDKKTFRFQGLLFKIVQNKSSSKFAPRYTLVIISGKEVDRVSGLFIKDQTTLSGDVLVGTEKHYFTIEIDETGGVVLSGLLEALRASGRVVNEDIEQSFNRLFWGSSFAEDINVGTKG